MAETVSSEVPQWIQRKVHFTDDSVSRDIQVGWQMGQQAQQNRAQEEYRRSQLASLQAYREVQINETLARQRMREAELTDAALISAWMQDPRQPPPDGLRTPKALKTVADVQKAYTTTEIGSKFAAANKAFAEKIKDLDGMGALRVQQALDQTEGKITPEIAALIDSETARIKTTLSDTRVLDEQGQPFVEGSGKPTFIQSLKTGALHKLPPDWSTGMQLIPLRDEAGTIRGYGVPNSSGGITQLQQAKPPSATLDPVTKAAMTAEFKALQSWRETQPVSVKGKTAEKHAIDIEAEYQRRLKAIQDKYKVAPPEPVAQPKDDFKAMYDALPSGAEYVGPDGVRRRKR